MDNLLTLLAAADRLNPAQASTDQSLKQPSRQLRVNAGRHNLEEILAHCSMTCLNLRKFLAERGFG